MQWGVIIFFLLLTGCTQIQNDNLIIPPHDSTIKYQMDKMVESTKWLEELEPQLLSDKRNPPQAGVPVTPKNIFGIQTNEEPVYPSIPGFASLDTRQLGAQQEQCVRSFCRQLLKPERDIPPELMAAGMEYLLYIFLFNIQDIRSFSRYIIGKPFINECTYLIPVRLYTNAAPLDIDFFLIQEQNEWHIQQIYIRTDTYE